MILKIRASKSFKRTAILLSAILFINVVFPAQALALTGGPTQPEFNSFTPIGASDMVDLSSGDMNYNIPLMDVGGYPINIAYSSNVGMDQEASWVGLGWDLSVGQINRNVRGLPDDFKGDQMTYENHLKPNLTVGANFNVQANITGIDVESLIGANASVGVAASFNSYTGFSIKPSAGISLDLGKAASVGFNVESGENGLSLSPNASLHYQSKRMAGNGTKLSANVGASYNSRQGLVSRSVNISKSAQLRQLKYTHFKAGNARGSASLGSVVAYAEELYTPSKRVAMKTESFTLNAGVGLEVFGTEPQGQITAYGTITTVRDVVSTSRAYGYANTHEAGEEDVLDFNLEKDGSFSVNTTNMPVANYTYDIYSIQGQGVSGTYRPYRNQVGYIYDTKITDFSASGTIGVEVGAAQTAHVGVDIETTTTNSSSGGWFSQNNILSALGETNSSNPNFENVHYRNVGDLSSDRELGAFKTKIGDYQAIRIPFSGGQFGRTLNGAFSKKISSVGMNESNLVALNGQQIKRTERQSRNQTINNVTFEQLEKGVGYGPIARNYNLRPAAAKSHHVGEVQIIRNDGARYIYGEPLYNTTKKETTFAVNGNMANSNTGLVSYNPSSFDNPMNPISGLPNDQYFNRITTPGYVHTYLLSSILSTDYFDRENDGPTPDDFGSYTLFTYTDGYPRTIPTDAVDPPDAGVYKWRVPFQANQGSYNEGMKTDPKDDQGNYVYGEKQVRYIRKVETKTHVAIFHVSPRHDGYGVNDEHGSGIPNPETSLSKSFKLDSISLYSVGEYYNANHEPIQTAVPIKTVHFEYDYELCQGVINNDLQGPDVNQGGKLTLKKIHFTYRNSKMGKYTGYEFGYSDYNPGYDLKGYDTWGNYLPPNHSNTITGMPTAAEFPYTNQQQATQNEYASAWLLKKIKLPSGGEISLVYESDEYAYVQDKKVNRMYKVAGVSASPDPDLNDLKQELYTAGMVQNHTNYLIVDLDEDELQNIASLATIDAMSETQIEQLFFDVIQTPIQFRFFLNMTQLGGAPGTNNLNNAKFDYVSGYCSYDTGRPIDVKLYGGQAYLILPVTTVHEENIGSGATNPIAKGGWQFGRKFLNKYVYSLNPNDEENDIEAIANQLVGADMINSLMEIIEGPNGALEQKMIARRFIPEKSWVRLKDPDGVKLGGGARVKEVRISDNWDQMLSTGQQSENNPNSLPNFSQFIKMEYGQSYSYDLPNGKTSGVATYEPIGNKENPLVQPVTSHVEKLLAPDEENYMEAPFGESFFPSPQVTYSRVSVSSLNLGTNTAAGQQIKSLHRTGKVVSEFYTSKDYPVIVDQTKLQTEEDKTDLLSNLLNLNTKKHFTASQGYVIHLNDMNAKQKSQMVYAEGQDDAISGVEYIYDINGSQSVDITNANQGRLNNSVTVVAPNGEVKNGTIGVEIDVVNHLRENKSKTITPGMNTNLATIIAGVIPIPIPVPLPDYSQSEDQFRSATTTKVINTFGILRETIAYDAGARVSTRNLAWDEATGEVLVTETVDEFNDKYYTLNYPAHWVYKGMGQAYTNTGLSGSITSLGSGVYNPGGNYLPFFMPGDELIVYNSSEQRHAWVSQVGSGLVLIDASGATLNLTGTLDYVVLRSARRNLQSAGIMNVTLMKNPLQKLDGSPIQNLSNLFTTQGLDAAWKIINAGAVEYSSNWKVSCECGIEDKQSTYNPYAINELGVWRTKSSRTYLTGRNYAQKATPRVDGYFAKFAPMYKRFNNAWVHDYTGWTKVTEVEQYSPYGFEVENRDALNRFSAALYGYNNMFPIAVGANTEYKKIGFDGFEDRNFGGCPHTPHFQFNGEIVNKAHTGKKSLKIGPGQRSTLEKKLNCGQIEDFEAEEEGGTVSE